MNRCIFLTSLMVLVTSASAGVDLHCYPNPAVSGRDEVNISIQPPADGEVTIQIYSVDGFPVRTILESESVNGGGAYIVARWDMNNDAGDAVSPGAYIVRLEGDFGDGKVTEKFVLVVDI